MRYLNLSTSSFVGVENLQWVAGMSSLEYLDMSAVNLRASPTETYEKTSTTYSFVGYALSNSSDWLQVLNMLPSLLELRLYHCFLSTKFDNQLHGLSNVNFTSLTSLDLSYNLFNSSIPNWLYNLTDLEYLDLSLNSLYGPIPGALQNLRALKVLLSKNIISNDVGNHTSLTGLYLKSYELEGEISGEMPSTLADLCRLQKLNLSDSTLNKLNILDLSRNLISRELPQDWICWKSLNVLMLENNNLSGSIPSSIGYLLSLNLLNLRSNNLSGELPSYMQNSRSLRIIDIGKNKFSGMDGKKISRSSYSNSTFKPV
ncbi:hypothetical protein GIB67_008013 [Kingdonia uniflora]|uniref:Uncharacterized protein n=1 Tax=Kingdonia uniflora TaxID=39325 RepID=A0A7J7MXQ5_9MAGN|nr:hypothetical protein GIB67_008013 [Kingdonia uniflora]